MEATAKAQADNDLSKMLSEGRAEQGGGGCREKWCQLDER